MAADGAGVVTSPPARPRHPARPLRRPLAIIMVGALVLPEVIVGITEASSRATR
jgi:hypothetical protein